jgi:hypothetical protein
VQGLPQYVEVLKRISHILLIIAVLTASGSHWLVLQSVAWTNMLMDNLQSRSVTQALECTFDGKHPCKLCKQIVKGKQTEKKSELRMEWKRLEFSYAPSVFVFGPPSFFWDVRATDDLAIARSHTPLVPPPKLNLG